MPTYNYQCRGCNNTFTEQHAIDDRKKPTEQQCEKCGGEIFISLGTAGFITDSKSTLTRAGSEWQDLLKRIKKGSGRSNSIHD